MRLPEPAGFATDASSETREPQVHLWQANLDQPPETIEWFANSVLAADELDRARRFHFELDRRRFVARRGLLRSVIGWTLGLEPGHVRFAYGPNGKPELAGAGQGAAIHFNSSYSSGVGLFALARAGSVGVDLECLRSIPEWSQIAAATFSDAETAFLRSLPPELASEAFLRAWTRHEAILKASGAGLGRGDGKAPLDADSWTVLSLCGLPGFVGALATAGPGYRLVRMAWPAAIPVRAKDAGRRPTSDVLGLDPLRNTRVSDTFPLIATQTHDQ